MPDKTFTLDELYEEAKVFLGELDASETAEAAESLDWLFRSLDPNRSYTTADLKAILTLFEAAIETVDKGE
jgi:hypothetical protein